MSIEDSNIVFVQSYEDVQNYFSWLGERREWMAFDTETGGLEHWKQPLRLVQIGDTETGWVFRADRWLGVIEETFQKYEGKIVGQNVGFDVRFLECQGGLSIPWRNLYDTKVMAHAIDPTKSTSLKALGAAHLSPKAKKLQGALHAAMQTQKWGWADIPYDFPIYWGYAGLDVILTARIAEAFWPKITADYQQVFDLEMQVSRICSNMEVKGIKIDLEYVKEKYEQITEYTSRLEDYCVNEWGVRPSETQKVAIKLNELGVDLTKTTTTGSWAMDKDVLEGIDHPLAKAVLEHRQKTKVGSSYFKNFLNMHADSVLHPSINTLGARTGRMSIQNPAAQTLPRGRIVRDAFIPRDGHSWCSVDYDNIEMKLLAHFCGDEKMIEAARTSDMHAAMAKIAYKDESITKSDPRRQTFKNANFAKAFVAGAEKFAWTAGMEIEPAKEFLAFYDEEFPGVKAFQKRVERVGRDREQSTGRGYVKSPIGRIHFSEKDKLYTLVNSLIQGTAADCFKQSLVDLDNSGFGEYLLLPVHDETNLEFPTESAEEMRREAERIMTQLNWAAPLTVSGSTGASWGEAK
jgi:DNA polymerase-1